MSARAPSRTPSSRAPRFALLMLGMLALAGGLAGGLVRLGWTLPPHPLTSQAAAGHGVLMLSGLFGVVIGLERAVALGRTWAYLSPLACGAGTVALLAAAPSGLAFGAYSLGFLVLLLSTLAAALRQAESFMGVLLLGAWCALLANLLWALGAPLSEGLLLQFAFLVLTVAGERLELSRYLQRPPWAAPALAAVLLGLLGSLALPEAWSARAFGAALLLLALWLARFDLARRTVRQTGLTRYVAVALLSGYLQLALAGVLMLGFGLQAGHASYDASLHALGLGFVVSMVFGHAPLIAPALLRVRLRFSPWVYLPLAMLHGSLVMRLAALALDDFVTRRWAGMASALAILLFMALMLASGVRGSRLRPPARQHPA